MQNIVRPGFAPLGCRKHFGHTFAAGTVLNRPAGSDQFKLNQFARQIAAKDYYKDWPEDYLGDLFQFREDPRT